MFLTSQRLYDERLPLEPAYPAVRPSQAGGTYADDADVSQHETLLHAPPGYELTIRDFVARKSLISPASADRAT